MPRFKLKSLMNSLVSQQFYSCFPNSFPKKAKKSKIGQKLLVCGNVSVEIFFIAGLLYSKTSFSKSIYSEIMKLLFIISKRGITGKFETCVFSTFLNQTMRKFKLKSIINSPISQQFYLSFHNSFPGKAKNRKLVKNS